MVMSQTGGPRHDRHQGPPTPGGGIIPGGIIPGGGIMGGPCGMCPGGGIGGGPGVKCTRRRIETCWNRSRMTIDSHRVPMTTNDYHRFPMVPIDSSRFPS